MADKYYLNDRDRLTLRDVIEWWRRYRANVGGQSSTVLADQNGSPEAYAVKTPPGGIPALTNLKGSGGTGTGTGTDDPVSSKCEAYQKVYMPDGTEELLPTGLMLDVYNLSLGDIPGNAFVPTIRDKYGTWYVLVTGVPTPPGGGSNVVRGTLTTSMSFGGTATCQQYYNVGAGEVAYGSPFTVYDWLLQSGQSIASGKNVFVTYDEVSKRWYVIDAQCP